MQNQHRYVSLLYYYMQVYVPGQEGKDVELEVDNSAYEMLHRMNVEWPMLSFDFVGDTLGQQRTKVGMITAHMYMYLDVHTDSDLYIYIYIYIHTCIDVDIHAYIHT